MLAKVPRTGLYAWIEPVLAQPLLTIAVVASYFLLSRSAEMLPVAGSPITLLWLPAGLAVALLFLRGTSVLPALLVGALLANIRDFLFLSDLKEPAALTAVVSFSVLNVLEPWLIYALYRRLAGETPPFRNERTLLLFFTSVLVCCAGFGFAFALVSNYLGVISQVSLSAQWALFCLADATAIFLLSPAVLLHQQSTQLAFLRRHSVEFSLWVASLTAICYLNFSHRIDMVFLVLPPLVWAATRFSQAGAALAILVASLACFLTPLLGSVTRPELLSPTYLVRLELHLILMTSVALYISTLLEDRQRIEMNLEDMVNERTQQLEFTNQALQDEIYVRKQAERSFRTSSRRYRALFETAGSPIIVMDKDFTIRQWNSAAERLFGYAREEIIGKNYVQCFVPKEYQDETAWKITKVLESGVARENLESEALSFDSASHTMLWNINRLVDSDEQLTQAIIIGQDITAIRQTQDKLHYLAHYDVLTGIANRRLFEDRCKQAIKSSIRNKSQVGLISLDVDHFKRINDTLGHDAGDMLLKEIASRLLSCVRKEDTISRLGGDEFAVLLHQVNGPEGAELVARNILEAVLQPISVPGQELVITTSIGITMAPTDGVDYNDLLKNADMAMYRAKKAGRNNIQFYRKDMNEELQRQMQIEQELRVALQEHQFSVHYLPVMDLEDDRIIGLEALLRWQHPQRGLLAPREFLRVAEQSGLLPTIGEWVFYNTCLQGKAIQAMSEHPVQISVNLSQRQFQHPALVDTLERVLLETRFNPRYLALEIHENTVAAHPEEAIEILEKLRRLGVSLTIDSFGSGFSSLIHLSRLPVETIKIDRRIISGIPDNENEVAIAETLLTIAQKMGLRVIVEGIEKPEQEAFFQRYHCRFVQGHLYSLPISDRAMPELFYNIHRNPRQNAGKQIGLPI